LLTVVFFDPLDIDRCLSSRIFTNLVGQLRPRLLDV
jgi:hypothetical protein